MTALNLNLVILATSLALILSDANVRKRDPATLARTNGLLLSPHMYVGIGNVVGSQKQHCTVSFHYYPIAVLCFATTEPVCEIKVAIPPL